MHSNLDGLRSTPLLIIGLFCSCIFMSVQSVSRRDYIYVFMCWWRMATFCKEREERDTLQTSFPVPSSPPTMSHTTAFVPIILMCCVLFVQFPWCILSANATWLYFFFFFISLGEKWSLTLQFFLPKLQSWFFSALHIYAVHCIGVTMTN